jgi:hypothetical protein
METLVLRIEEKIKNILLQIKNLDILVGINLDEKQIFKVKQLQKNMHLFLLQIRKNCW